MRTRWRSGSRAIALAGLVAGFLLACDDATGPGDAPSVGFDYAGALEGRFSSEAGPPVLSVEGVPEFGEWTLAAAGDSVGGVVVSGFRVSDETGDLFVLQLTERRTGSFTCGIGLECHGRILFGIPDHAGLPPAQAERWFEITSGTVELGRAEGARLVGTFSFTARDEGGTGPNELTVEDGSFDLPLEAQAAGRSILCFGATAAGEDC